MTTTKLRSLAKQINQEFAIAQELKTSEEEAGRRHDRAQLNYRIQAKKVGELLVQAKKDCVHGEWLDWLSKNCPDITERTAQQYMSYARGDAADLNSGGRGKTSRDSDSAKQGSGKQGKKKDPTTIDDIMDPTQIGLTIWKAKLNVIKYKDRLKPDHRKHLIDSCDRIITYLNEIKEALADA